MSTPPPLRKFPWDALPAELRFLILHLLPLDDLLSRTQSLFPNDARPVLDIRIRALHPLWAAWLDSPIAVRNLPAFRTRAARLACTPADFVRLPRLVLGASRLTGVLTDAIAELGTNLKVLHLDENQLTHLPDALGKCENLLVLDCSANAFRTFPVVATRLKQLRYLSFGQNPRLGVFPTEVAAMPNVKAVSFYMCSLKSIPLEIVSKALQTRDFSLNVAANDFPRLYLMGICEQFPAFKRKLTHVMVE